MHKGRLKGFCKVCHYLALLDAPKEKCLSRVMVWIQYFLGEGKSFTSRNIPARPLINGHQ
ncbi:MAG: hypothetical protein CR994_05255 [Maribacter sp.]|nr:MAG: hypothetical protein CR994_05255 [Maribacter sp.]